MIIRSISRFLIITVLLLITTAICSVGYWSYIEARHEVEELFDAELAQHARTLQSLFRNQLSHTQLTQSLHYQPPQFSNTEDEEEEASTWGHKYEKKLNFQVWNNEGNLLLSNTNVLAIPSQPQPGFHDETIEKRDWRSFQLYDKQLKVWIKVAQRSDIREEVTDEIVEGSLIPLLLLIPLLGVSIAFVIRQGMAPLKALSDEIETRDANHLQTVNMDKSPKELHSVIQAINQFMSLLSQAFKRERDFTADAAHELRTPLAAIRVHTQNLHHFLESTTSENNKTTNKVQKTLKHILTGVDRMTHVVNQLLDLLRLQQPSATKEEVPLDQLINDIVNELSPLAQKKQQKINTIIKQNITIVNNKNTLDTLCRNIITNAILYTPEEGKIQIILDKNTLQIADNGPGIPDEEKEKVFERFYRRQHQHIEGSGLGLAISKEIANQLGASIHLADNTKDASGLIVAVLFT